MKETTTKWLSPLKYPVPAHYEEWLESLAAEGWHPVKIGQSGAVAMKFEKSEPRKYRYVVDYQPRPTKRYKRIYEDFGWEYTGRMGNAFYWRMEYTDARPESFTDPASLRRRNDFFIATVAPVFIACCLLALFYSATYPMVFARLIWWEHVQYIAVLAFSYCVGLILGKTLGLLLKYRRHPSPE